MISRESPCGITGKTLAELTDRFTQFAKMHGVRVEDVKLRKNYYGTLLVCKSPQTDDEIKKERQEKERARKRREEDRKREKARREKYQQIDAVNLVNNAAASTKNEQKALADAVLLLANTNPTLAKELKNWAKKESK